LISSYVWNGAVVGCGKTTSTGPLKLSRFKPSNILQWELNELNTSGGQWNDLANKPMEAQVSLSKRHGSVAQVGRFDGSAGRIPIVDVNKGASAAAVNDLWCYPDSANGH
jgi:hypothetical protein